jgi:hypothetical protein
MSRARGMRGARKMRSFIKDRVAAVASEEELEAALERSGDRLLVVEFGAVRSTPAARRTRGAHAHAFSRGASRPRLWRRSWARWLAPSSIWEWTSLVSTWRRARCAAVDGAALRAGLIWRALSGAGRQACDSLCADVPLVSCRSYAGEINRGDA